MNSTHAHRKASGLCTGCGGQRDDHRLLCQSCRDRYNEKNRASYLKRAGQVPEDKCPLFIQKVNRLKEIQSLRRKLDKEAATLLVSMSYELNKLKRKR